MFLQSHDYIGWLHTATQNLKIDKKPKKSVDATIQNVSLNESLNFCEL